MTAPAIEQPLVGGSLSLDLLNTVWRRNGNRFDWLTDDAAVVEFSERSGEPPQACDIDATRTALVAARTLISDLTGHGRGDIPASLAAEVDAMLADVSVRLRPGSAMVEIVGQPTTRRVAVAALLDALRLLADRPERIRTCRHDDCTLRFVDTSKAGRRRWCSMEVCGNRAKAKRHHDKTSAERRSEAG